MAILTCFGGLNSDIFGDTCNNIVCNLFTAVAINIGTLYMILSLQRSCKT